MISAFRPPASARQGYHKLVKTTLPSSMTRFYTIVSLEGKCDTLADRIKEANAYTKSDIEEKAEERKSLKAELDASEGLVPQL